MKEHALETNYHAIDISKKICLYFLFILLSVVVLYPLFWMVLNSFKTLPELYTNSLSLPKELQFDNYRLAWEIGLSSFFFNSVLVSVISVSSVTFIGALAAYGFSRFNFKGRNPLFYLVLGGLTLAGEVALLPLFRILQALNFYNTYLAMIIPYIAFRLPFATFLIRSYFLSFPSDLEDAAYIDGLNSFSIFLKIVIPVSKPILASSVIMTLLWVWNEFLFALVFVENKAIMTIPIGLVTFKTHLRTDYVTILAGVAMSMMPIVVLFLILQKSFVRGLTAGSSKG
jgi:raffinose/stachyose/melibiose transport system permease protein